MAYRSSKQNIDALNKKVDDHDQKITDQESVTKFFIIVVAATLVATLVSLGGLYISAFHEKNIPDDSNNEMMGNIISLMEKNQKELYDIKLEIQLMRAKNPYLK